VRIGIPLQSLNLRAGGIRVYTEEVVSHLLHLDRDNEYILMYPGFGEARQRSGQYSATYKNVTEVVTGAARIASGLYWDQIVLPQVARQYSIDVLFNPFLSVPVTGRFKKVMVMHNVEYHLIPKVYDWKMNVRWWFLETAILPAADRVISISNVMTQDFHRTVQYPIDNVRTVYHGVSTKFQVIRDTGMLQGMKAKYQLPDEFLLFVGHIYPQKNFGNLVRALHLLAPTIPHQLVVIGRPRWRYQEVSQVIDELKLHDRLQFLNEVGNDDLPAIYNLATCLVYPSLYESFGLVQLEAMACGCPVVGANAGAIPEISGGAALLFDPYKPDDLAEKIQLMVSNPALRQEYIEKGFVRARGFTWERCATETLQVLQEVAGSHQVAPHRVTKSA
jgi:glycosyltransferase involved in cell wall biosynthesis